MHVCGIVAVAVFAAVVALSADVPEPPPAAVLESPALFRAAVFLGLFGMAYLPILIFVSALGGRIIKSAGPDGIAFEQQIVAGISDALHGSDEAVTALAEGFEEMKARLDEIGAGKEAQSEINRGLLEVLESQRQRIADLEDALAKLLARIEEIDPPGEAAGGDSTLPN